MANKTLQKKKIKENMELKETDIEKEIEFKISKEAFKAKHLYCSKCKIKMDLVHIDIEIPNTSLIARLEAYKCLKCGKEYLNSEQAKQFDKALIIATAMLRRGIVLERAANFDGYNIFVRFPAQLIKSRGKKIRTEIMPLSATDFIVHFKKK